MDEFQTTLLKSSSSPSPGLCWLCPGFVTFPWGHSRPWCRCLCPAVNEPLTHSLGWLGLEGVSGGHLSPTQDSQTCQVHVELMWVLNIPTHSMESAFLLRTIHSKKLTVFWKALDTLWDQILNYYGIQQCFFWSSFFERTISEQICQANRLLTEAWFDVSVIHCHCWTLMRGLSFIVLYK